MNTPEQFIDELSSKYYMQIFNYCLARLDSDGQAAADCAGDVFIAAKMNAEALKVHPDVLGWLYKAANHRIRKRFRDKRRYDKRLISLEGIFEDPDQSGKLRRMLSVSEETFIDQGLSDDEIERIKAQVLGTLTKEERELYDELITHCLPAEKVAKRLGISKDALRMRERRMLIKLKKELQKYTLL